MIMEFSWLGIALTLIVSFFSFHPLTLCLGLIVLTLSLSPLISFLLSKWVAYAIILIFLGGMMVLFIYVSTLAGNEKLVFFSSPNSGSLLLLLSIVSVPLLDPNLFLVSHLYNSLSVPLLLFLTLYLLATLIIVIFFAQGFKGALMSYL